MSKDKYAQPDHPIDMELANYPATDEMIEEWVARGAGIRPTMSPEAQDGKPAVPKPTASGAPQPDFTPLHKQWECGSEPELCDQFDCTSQPGVIATSGINYGFQQRWKKSQS